MLPKLLILGLGNDILTDDAVGLRVVRGLRSELADQPAIELQETTEMGLALLDYLTGYPAAFIVDSIETGQAEPGIIHELDATSLRQLTGGTPHFLGVGETLALGGLLGLPMPDVVKIFAIEAQDPFTLSTRMTPALEAALPHLIESLARSARLWPKGVGTTLAALPASLALRRGRPRERRGSSPDSSSHGQEVPTPNRPLASSAQ